MAELSDSRQAGASHKVIFDALKAAIWEMDPRALDLSDIGDFTHVAIFGALDLQLLAARLSDVCSEKRAIPLS